MSRTLKLGGIAAAALAVAACEKADNEPGPGGVTMGEARALDEAAAMIEARRPPADLLAPSPDAPSPGVPSAVASAAAAPPDPSTSGDTD